MVASRLYINSQNLDYELPDELIAQVPLEQREQAKLMVVDRRLKSVSHQKFFDVIDFLKEGDVLVLNNAQVNSSKFIGKKKTGGRVEVILISPSANPNEWRALVRPFLSVGTEFSLGPSAQVVLSGREENGENILRFIQGDPEQLMKEEGQIPLPPYIKREENDARLAKDEKFYQTVYSSKPGSIAAPTAGLHFTEDLLVKIKNKGIQIEKLTLHVGWGTFKPVAKTIDEHQMMSEQFEIDGETLDRLYQAKNEKKRIVAVGTTATRTLESLPEKNPGQFYSSATSIFIKPGFSFRWVNALITNFHVPRSTPISLVAAFMGQTLLEESYHAAIENKYRFYSYGDAMLIL